MVRLFFILLLTFTFTYLHAQDNHEWNTQIGPKASLLGGAMTASVTDNSALFYNPGALAFVQNSSISAVAHVYEATYYKIDNATGPGGNVSDFPFRSSPLFFSGIAELKQIPFLSFTYGYLKKRGGDVSLTSNTEGIEDIDPSMPGNEIYISNYERNQSIEEDWFGFGFGVEVTEKLGIGFSNFITLVTSKNLFNEQVSVFDYDTNNNLVLSGRKLDEAQGEFDAGGWLAMLGFNYNMQNIKLGLNVTFPRINMAVFNTGKIRREEFIGQNNSSTNNNYGFDDKPRITYRSPFIFDLGAEFHSEEDRYMIRLGYSGKVGAYTQIEGKNKSQVGEFVSSNRTEDFLYLRYAQKPIINVGIGTEKHLRDQLYLLLGFRTDFNFYDDRLNNENGNALINSLSTWNFYHFSGGLNLYLKKTEITAGVSYSFAYQDNIEMFTNIQNPDPNNDFTGVITNDAQAQVHQLKFLLGITYLFSAKIE